MKECSSDTFIKLDSQAFALTKAGAGRGVGVRGNEKQRERKDREGEVVEERTERGLHVGRDKRQSELEFEKFFTRT